MLQRDQLPDAISIGLHVPGVDRSALGSKRDYIEFFRAAEALGFDALWAEDRILHPAHLADPIVLLTLAAAHTDDMLLGSAVAVLNLREAPVFARQLATLDHFSDQRLVVGVSVGGRPDEYAAMRGGTAGRVTRFNESIGALRGLLSGAPYSGDGQVFALDEAIVRPRSEAPLLIGGVADAALRRAGRLGDGWIMAPFGSLDDFTRGWRMVCDSATAAGRDPSRLSAGRLIYVCTDPRDRAKARQQLGTFLSGYYGNSGIVDVDRDGIFGTPREVADAIAVQVEAGITNLMLAVPTLDTTHLAHLADALIPTLRALRA